ncbi:hypothetical protein VOLCADRAFT_104793 [Volvox carteri f. nagariensis]|uniref:SRCR domain-containing protein n=1 Tax=Volvox carteri f. nagariensis TaxID=3068 RepID=D8TW34_VOLCA|nr:uncharacterized protein VOLCADRAFT_104793 [Volvox carteri f. nagariensis]EFJ48299.1 hypothetical protein VOLCADRAFT_104793 [Volvox carteri f. nagariensis]|eukprot:XP_002950553.1 hypothetical protein VOLCADRAFT_104793 [Volvox carteri f. nagariensis]
MHQMAWSLVLQFVLLPALAMTRARAGALPTDILTLGTARYVLKAFNYKEGDGTFVKLDKSMEVAVGYVFAVPFPISAAYPAVPVCLPGGWDDIGAAAACRQAGFSTGRTFATGGNTGYPKVQLTGTVSVRNITCPNGATSLSQCTATRLLSGVCKALAAVVCKGAVWLPPKTPRPPKPPPPQPPPSPPRPTRRPPPPPPPTPLPRPRALRPPPPKSRSSPPPPPPERSLPPPYEYESPPPPPENSPENTPPPQYEYESPPPPPENTNDNTPPTQYEYESPPPPPENNLPPPYEYDSAPPPPKHYPPPPFKDNTQPSGGDVRLIGGLQVWEGRVEIFFRGQWGVVCGRWTSVEAAMVCRQLGFNSTSVRVTRWTPPPNLPIWLSDINCSKIDARSPYKGLAACNSNGIGVITCQAGSDVAGVRCFA